MMRRTVVSLVGIALVILMAFGLDVRVLPDFGAGGAGFIGVSADIPTTSTCHLERREDPLPWVNRSVTVCDVSFGAFAPKVEQHRLARTDGPSSLALSIALRPLAFLGTHDARVTLTVQSCEGSTSNGAPIGSHASEAKFNAGQTVSLRWGNAYLPDPACAYSLAFLVEVKGDHYAEWTSLGRTTSIFNFE